MIEAKDLYTGYSRKKVLQNVNISFKKGKLYAIIGINGCGKTTLLKTLGGIIPKISGELTVDGVSIETFDLKQRAQKISYLSQHRNIPQMTVGELVLHGRYAHLKYPCVYSDDDKNLANHAMKQMAIDDISHLSLSEISGGTCQKAYLAMALAQNSEYILMDEPTTHLDIYYSYELMNILRRLTANGKCVIAVLHDIPLAMRYADEVCVVDLSGRVTCNTPEEIFNSGIISSVFNIDFARQKLNDDFTYYIC